MDVVSKPIGPEGSLVISESAGIVSLEIKDAAAKQGISADLKISVATPVLLAGIAASMSDGVVKTALLGVAALLGQAPA